ncbi:hypothetical protein PGT21_022942 [Puccinia graminis f. sp. tritici]|uniref:DUF6818 domain-containing protein n=1 Tax=Puccinia graminis f. sp. tritici TaxID=56615 RepID=A0A5B0QJD2_PUCGR|nr:hypothetical protein PGT21_022942 [Puccinia graminis f. sp. tritici]
MMVSDPQIQASQGNQNPPNPNQTADVDTQTQTNKSGSSRPNKGGSKKNKKNNDKSTTGKKTGGRPPGSLGYNVAEFLLLNRPEREADNLKQKFKGLAQSQKPTGNATCPEHIREAKRVDALINEKANECALGSLSSGDERNGVGADVLSSDDDDVDVNETTGELESGQPEGAGTLLSGWSQTQLANQDLGDSPNPSQTHSMRGQTYQSPLVHRTHSQASSARPSPMMSVNRRSRGRPGDQLESRLNSFLDMDARKEQDREQSLSSFYSAQLMEANATIRDLRSELARVRGGIQSDVIRLQEEKHRLELENTSLKSKIEVLQLRANMQPNAAWGQMHHPHMFNHGFAMQSLPVFATHHHQQPPTGINPQLANTSGLNNAPGVNQPQPTGLNLQHAAPTSLNQQQPSSLTPDQVGFHPQQQPQGQHHFSGISDALEADPSFPHP